MAVTARALASPSSRPRPLRPPLPAHWPRATQLRALPAVLALLAVQPAVAQVSVKDDLGHTITLAQPARRVVSLAPHLTEDLFAIGAGPLLVGAVNYSDYPAEALKLPRVGGYNGFDLERIRALKPDLIVAWETGNPARQLAQVEALGIPLFRDNSRTLDDVPKALARLGTLAGHEADAAAAARRFGEHIARLERQYAARPPVRVFYQIWDRPLMTVNKQQIISDAMRVCGAVNVFAELPTLTPTVDDEAVLVANPELIATGGDGANSIKSLDRWRRWPRLAAVRMGQLAVLPPDLLVRMGPRLPLGVEHLCQAVDRARQAR